MTEKPQTSNFADIIREFDPDSQYSLLQHIFSAYQEIPFLITFDNIRLLDQISYPRHSILVTDPFPSIRNGEYGSGLIIYESDPTREFDPGTSLGLWAATEEEEIFQIIPPGETLLINGTPSQPSYTEIEATNFPS